MGTVVVAYLVSTKGIGFPGFGALVLDWMWAGTKDHVATQGAAQGEGQLLQYPDFRIYRQGIEGERGACRRRTVGMEPGSLGGCTVQQVQQEDATAVPGELC